MNSTSIALVFLGIVVLAGLAVWYRTQQQQQQLALAQIANAPRNQIGAGIGDIVSGALGAAGVH